MAGGQADITFQIVPEHRICLFFGRGLITLGAIMDGIARVNAHPAFTAAFSTLVCFEEATVSFGEGDLDRYRDFFRAHQAERTVTRWAVVTGNDITRSSARLAHLTADRSRIVVKVFAQRPAALRWLGRPESLAERQPDWALP